MKKLLLSKGEVTIEDIPAPARNPFNVLIEVSHSVISTGTEIASVQHSKTSLFDKIAKKPEQLMKGLESIRVRGLMKTLALVQTSQSQYQSLGYSCAGEVVAVGDSVTHLKVGDKVACGGSAIANHAEVVSVPENLVVRIPVGVSSRNASFATIGAISLQGVRRANVQLGETVAVIGLGLIGQLTVQLLKAAGCKVVGLDLDANRIQMAKKWGMEGGEQSPSEFQQLVTSFTNGHGVDATILTASTDSSDPTRQAFEITRKKGKIIVVGAVGMELARSPFYEKEQDFLISCSYGPGRYDPEYEQLGKDYPFGFVRWTENRNMSAFLDLVQDKKIDIESLIGSEYAIQDAQKAYEVLASKSEKKPLAVLLNYPKMTDGTVSEAASKFNSTVYVGRSISQPGVVRLGLIGYGGFVKSMHLPNLKSLSDKFKIVGVCAASGTSVATAGRQLQAAIMTTDYQAIIQDPRIDAVLIATRHDKHAFMAQEALRYGKHVFLEKPLALEMSELESLEVTMKRLSSSPTLVVGFNRRYAPSIKKILHLISRRSGPLVISYRVNAGELPSQHWTKTKEGGGRLRGEACHMIDLFQSLIGYNLKSISVFGAGSQNKEAVRPDENFSAQFLYDDGSLANLIYTSLGHSKLPKEYLEIHFEGKSIILVDFTRLTMMGKTILNETCPQDKGHKTTLEIFHNAIVNGVSFPTPWEKLVETTQAAIELDQAVWGRIPNQQPS